MPASYRLSATYASKTHRVDGIAALIRRATRSRLAQLAHSLSFLVLSNLLRRLSKTVPEPMDEMRDAGKPNLERHIGHRTISRLQQNARTFQASLANPRGGRLAGHVNSPRRRTASGLSST